MKHNSTEGVYVDDVVDETSASWLLCAIAGSRIANLNLNFEAFQTPVKCYYYKNKFPLRP